ncbi:MAG: hypothetical protein LBQ52_07795, partial [Helicobacteraceae bacterium]|nr:hypothetical protein [Helicobacteraceae bacterium]
MSRAYSKSTSDRGISAFSAPCAPKQSGGAQGAEDLRPACEKPRFWRRYCGEMRGYAKVAG